MTEQDIIQGCKRGRAKCQKELVLRYSPVLMTIARRYCKDDPAAKDVLQDAFIRIFKAIPQYKATGSFRGWLRRIVINEALKKQGRAAYQREQSGLADIGHPEVGPTVWKKLEAEVAIQLIQQLPEGFRMVFNLYVFEDYSHQGIVQQFNQNTDTLMGETAYTIRTREEVRHYNHIRAWEVPVLLGYPFQLGPVRILAEAGLGLRLQRSRSGIVLNGAQEPQIWPNIDGYKSTFSYTVQAQAMAIFPIGQRTSILGGVGAVIEPQSYTNASAAARELYQHI